MALSPGRALAVLGLLALSAFSPAPAVAAELTTEEIEAIVKDYLLREPEVVYQALENLQARQEQERLAAAEAAIEERAGELFAQAADPSMGAAEGVTVVEFMDYRCAFCRRMLPAIRQIIEEQDDVRIVFKELPVLGPDSLRAARAALASLAQRPEAYPGLHIAMMEAKDLSEAAILDLALDFGLDAERLLEDMASDAVGEAINRNYALAQALGIEGTPAFVIGGTLVPGAVDLATLEGLIDEARGSAVN